MPTKEWLETIEAAAKKMAEGPSKDERSSAYWTHWGAFMKEYVSLVTPQAVLELVHMARTAASVLIEREDLKKDSRFLKTEYTVQANDEDRTRMWEDWATDAADLGRKWDHRVEWVQDFRGQIVTVGELGTIPISITFTWATINRSEVVFWDATSQVVDYRLCETWIQKHFSKARRHVDDLRKVISEQKSRREKHNKS